MAAGIGDQYFWSVYFDAPRHAILWLLRKIDAKLVTTTDGVDGDFEHTLYVVGEITL